MNVKQVDVNVGDWCWYFYLLRYHGKSRLDVVNVSSSEFDSRPPPVNRMNTGDPSAIRMRRRVCRHPTLWACS